MDGWRAAGRAFQKRREMPNETCTPTGGGIVEFATRDEQDDAIRRLDDTEYKSKFDSSVAYIRVKKPKVKQAPSACCLSLD